MYYCIVFFQSFIFTLEALTLHTLKESSANNRNLKRNERSVRFNISRKDTLVLKWACLQHQQQQQNKHPRWTYLPALNYFLIEDAKLVADAVSISSQAQRGHGVQEASLGKKMGVGAFESRLPRSLNTTFRLSAANQKAAGTHQPGDPDHRCPDRHLPQCPAAPPCPGPAAEGHTNTRSLP